MGDYEIPYADYDDLDGCSSRTETLYICFEAIISETEKAWFIRFPMKADLMNDDHWMPKSQCEIADRKQGVIEVPRWLAEEKGIEEYEVEN